MGMSPYDFTDITSHFYWNKDEELTPYRIKQLAYDPESDLKALQERVRPTAARTIAELETLLTRFNRPNENIKFTPYLAKTINRFIDKRSVLYNPEAGREVLRFIINAPDEFAPYQRMMMLVRLNRLDKGKLVNFLVDNEPLYLAVLDRVPELKKAAGIQKDNTRITDFYRKVTKPRLRKLVKALEEKHQAQGTNLNPTNSESIIKDFKIAFYKAKSGKAGSVNKKLKAWISKTLDPALKENSGLLPEIVSSLIINYDLEPSFSKAMLRILGKNFPGLTVLVEDPLQPGNRISFKSFAEHKREANFQNLKNRVNPKLADLKKGQNRALKLLELLYDKRKGFASIALNESPDRETLSKVSDLAEQFIDLINWSDSGSARRDVQYAENVFSKHYPLHGAILLARLAQIEPSLAINNSVNKRRALTIAANRVAALPNSPLRELLAAKILGTLEAFNLWSSNNILSLFGFKNKKAYLASKNIEKHLKRYAAARPRIKVHISDDVDELSEAYTNYLDLKQSIAGRFIRLKNVRKRSDRAQAGDILLSAFIHLKDEIKTVFSSDHLDNEMGDLIVSVIEEYIEKLNATRLKFRVQRNDDLLTELEERESEAEKEIFSQIESIVEPILNKLERDSSIQAREVSEHNPLAYTDKELEQIDAIELIAIGKRVSDKIQTARGKIKLRERKKLIKEAQLDIESLIHQTRKAQTLNEGDKAALEFAIEIRKLEAEASALHVLLRRLIREPDLNQELEDAIKAFEKSLKPIELANTEELKPLLEGAKALGAQPKISAQIENTTKSDIEAELLIDIDAKKPESIAGGLEILSKAILDKNALNIARAARATLAGLMAFRKTLRESQSILEEKSNGIENEALIKAVNRSSRDLSDLNKTIDRLGAFLKQAETDPRRRDPQLAKDIRSLKIEFTSQASTYNDSTRSALETLRSSKTQNKETKAAALLTNKQIQSLQYLNSVLKTRSKTIVSIFREGGMTLKEVIRKVKPLIQALKDIKIEKVSESSPEYQTVESLNSEISRITDFLSSIQKTAKRNGVRPNNIPRFVKYAEGFEETISEITSKLESLLNRQEQLLG